MMRFVKIGKTKIMSSPIALGTDGFGTAIPVPEAHRMMDEYFARGGNHIDTAHIYGYGQNDEQLSEKCIGRYFKERGGRDKVVIATKGAHPNRATMHIPRLSHEELEKDLDESLLALGVDYVDIYYLHRDCVDVPVEGIIDSLNTFIKKGKIREIACSNWRGARIEAAVEYAAKSGQNTFAISQIQYSLARINVSARDKTLVEMDDREFSFYEETKMPVAAFAPQAKGFFAKLAAAGGDMGALSQKASERYLSDENMQKYTLALQASKELGVSISAVILGYLMAAPFPVIPVIGPRNTEQLIDSLTAMDFALPGEFFEKLKACDK